MKIAGWGSSDNKEDDTATSVPEGFESRTGRGPSYKEIIGMCVAARNVKLKAL